MLWKILSKGEEDQEIMTNFEDEESKDDEYQKVSYLKAICEVMFSGSVVTGITVEK